jgi:hypothetical protein
VRLRLESDARLAVADDAQQFRLVTTSCHLFDRLGYRIGVPARDACELPVDADVAWLVTEYLAPDVEEYLKPEVAEHAEESEIPSWVTSDEDLRAVWVEQRAKQDDRYRNVIATTEVILLGAMITLSGRVEAAA